MKWVCIFKIYYSQKVKLHNLVLFLKLQWCSQLDTEVRRQLAVILVMFLLKKLTSSVLTLRFKQANCSLLYRIKVIKLKSITSWCIVAQQYYLLIHTFSFYLFREKRLPMLAIQSFVFSYHLKRSWKKLFHYYLKINI